MNTPLLRLLTLGYLVFLSGCASASSVAQRAPVLRFAELAGHAQAARTLTSQEPFVLQFEPGDEIPVQFALDSAFVRTKEKPLALPLVATRRFWLLVDPTARSRHIRASLDGRNFDPPENGFRFGFGATPSSAFIDIGVQLEAAPKR